VQFVVVFRIKINCVGSFYNKVKICTLCINRIKLNSKKQKHLGGERSGKVEDVVREAVSRIKESELLKIKLGEVKT
jgi:hypothetical protein